MTNTTTTAAGFVGPAELGPLILEPVSALSIAFNPAVSTVVYITQATNAYRFPRVAADPTAQWVNEGDEISPSDATLDEDTVVPSKVAGLSIITSELAADSNPAAAQVVGDGLARDISRKVDTALVGNVASPAPPGLGAQSGTQTYVNAGAFGSLDFAAQAISKAESVGATVTAFITSPAVALQLATIKIATGYNAPVLGMDATSATSRNVLGVPLVVTPFGMPANTLYAIDGSRIFTVVREDIVVDSDASPFYTSDRVAVRAIMRVGFGFPHPASVVKVSTS